MNGPNGQACPECAAPRRPDGTPSCGCTRRAAEALQGARTAQAAAAEDFDPLRIRPYVELDDETVRLAAVPAEAAVAARLTAAPDWAEPAAAAPDGAGAAADMPADTAVGPRRRRRAALLATGGALAAVLGAAALASGLFYDPPKRDGALPGQIRASVPEQSSPAGTSAPVATASAASRSPRTSPPPSRSSSPSPSSPSPTPSGPPATASPTATPQPRNSGPVLRVGDKGPQVTELQLRLRQLGLYQGPTNGAYNTRVANAVRTYQLNRGITEDEPGVYGTATRTELESETTKP